MQNMVAGVTKDTYFEICELMGNEPEESEIPVDLEDLPLEVQQAFDIYYMLRDEWDGMSGSYTGKSLVGISELLEINEIEIEDRRSILAFLKIIDSARSKELNK